MTVKVHSKGEGRLAGTETLYEHKLDWRPLRVTSHAGEPGDIKKKGQTTCGRANRKNYVLDTMTLPTIPPLSQGKQFQALPLQRGPTLWCWGQPVQVGAVSQVFDPVHSGVAIDTA